MSIPAVDVDLYDDAVLDDPYPQYRALREAGPVVWLPRNRLFALARHADVRAALRAPALFSSAQGVAANDATNAIARGNLLASDPPLHTALRRVVAAPLLPGELAKIRPQIEAEAEALVERLVARRRFDAVADLAHHLPLAIVSKLVGLPEDGRQAMLRWSAATFDTLGADNERCRAARPLTQDMRAYIRDHAGPDQVRPGSWAARLYAQGDAGVVPRDLCPTLMRDYLGPSLDTTILATGSVIALLARHPGQWDLLRAEPGLIPNAIEEAIRIESPIRGFTRALVADHAVDGVALPAGARVLLLFASANRDERKWQDPDRFDIRRDVTGSVGFGAGIHMCAGMHLARIEIRALLEALVRRAARIEAEDPVPFRNNTLRGPARLDVTVTPA